MSDPTHNLPNPPHALPNVTPEIDAGIRAGHYPLCKTCRGSGQVYQNARNDQGYLEYDCRTCEGYGVRIPQNGETYDGFAYKEADRDAAVAGAPPRWTPQGW